MAERRRKKWKREFSAGGAVYRRTAKGPEILLIMPNQRNKNKPLGIWHLPKGLIDPGETAEQAAVREVKEEAGVKGEIESKLGSINLFYRWDGENVWKTVTFYLMIHRSGRPTRGNKEVHEAKWYPFEEALATLGYKNEQAVLRRARKFLFPKPPRKK